MGSTTCHSENDGQYHSKYYDFSHTKITSLFTNSIALLRMLFILLISERALADVRTNAALNGLEDRIRTVCGDVFDKLREYKRDGQRFDLVVLDPPAFCKSAADVPNAYRGYRDINVLGMKLVRSGGFLATASCSHYMTLPLFE